MQKPLAAEKVTGVSPEQVDNARRAFFSAGAIFAASTLLKAQEKKVDGGLAVIEDKKIPERTTPIVPAGALSIRNLRSIVRLASFVYQCALIKFYAHPVI